MQPVVIPHLHILAVYHEILCIFYFSLFKRAKQLLASPVNALSLPWCTMMPFGSCSWCAKPCLYHLRLTGNGSGAIKPLPDTQGLRKQKQVFGRVWTLKVKRTALNPCVPPDVEGYLAPTDLLLCVDVPWGTSWVVDHNWHHTVNQGFALTWSNQRWLWRPAWLQRNSRQKQLFTVWKT